MTKRSFQVILALITALMIVFGGGSFLYAQEGTSDEFTLEEITVTAQKRAENQQKVPIAIDTISGEELALKGKTDVDDILGTLANVTINTMQDGMRISIRGLTDNEDVAMGTSFKVSGSMVGVNIDGVQNSMSNAGQNLFDVERVEVLYGPQSTLYGSNSPGGIVNVVTAAPKTDRYSATVSANYGSYSSLDLQAALNAPVIQDKVAMRLSVSHSKQNTWVSGETGSKNTSVRLKALWQAHDNLTITLTPTWSKSGNGGMMSGRVKPFKYQDGNYEDGTKVTNPWTEAEETTGGGPMPPMSFRGAGSLVASQGPPPGGGGGPGGDQVTKGLSANIDWNTVIGTFSLVPSYNKSTSESTGEDFEGYTFNSTSTSKQTQTELRVTNPEGFKLFQWIIGATYNQWNQSMNRVYEDPDLSSSNTDFYIKSNKKALYANITYPLWFYERFALTLGYRQSWDTNDSKSMGLPGMSGARIQTGKYSKPDIKYGFNWDALENVMVYGSFANSYRSINAQAAPGMEDKPEKLAATTLGVKSRLFENKVQLNGSIYLYDYTNKSERTEMDYGYFDENVWGDLDDDGVIESSVYISSRGFPLYGDFKSLGQDLSATWIITNEDRLNLSVSHMDAEWSNLVKPASESYPQLWPSVSYEGSQNYNSPEWSVTAGYERNIMLGNWGVLTPAIDTQYKTEYSLKFDPGEEDTSGFSYQEAYFLWNGSVSLNSSSGKWSLSASVKNITNYAVKRSYVAQGDNVVLFLNDPRTYRVGFSYKF